ncbi:TPA: STAS domain-containing protein [Photobacterium damselae]|uniref:STAS domain-containing protein n=1 Tax=Photobacterium damselae TaxID=38293 RepID=UPI00083B1524|nr:STAS domain-containing protein [Photobacterium damselae]ODA23203.1 anti-anti-sigma factor [Photobacterium damselae subsp. damselae]TLS65268.1 STAS domain-containing protein [Photobacterium damselae subsp. damselae]
MTTQTSTIHSLTDDFDAQSARQLETMFSTLSLCDSHELILDMTQVTFIDSCGVGAIVFLYKRLKARQRNLKLLNVNGQVRELLLMLRIDKVIPFITSADLPS